ncbi:MAG: hypothetical protein KDK91_31080 [Gammaproteobacteria bacterium]|nr:hypothetical protein [Gammaproteobacteria bacterium]
MPELGTLDIDALARRLQDQGLTPGPESLQQMHAMLPVFAALVARVHRDFRFEHEPAHVPAFDAQGLPTSTVAPAPETTP